MRKKLTEEEVDDLRPEYDLETLLPSGVQGKYADRCREGTNIALLDGDVAAAFPNDEAINEALRLVIKLSEVTRKQKKSASKQSTP